MPSAIAKHLDTEEVSAVVRKINSLGDKVLLGRTVRINPHSLKKTDGVVHLDVTLGVPPRVSTLPVRYLQPQGFPAIKFWRDKGLNPL